MLVYDFLENNARNFPDNCALMELNHNGETIKETLSWKQFNSLSNRIANWLYLQGIRKGDKVALLMPNCINWLPIYFGILKASAVAVPINCNYQVNDICHCLNITKSKLLLFAEEFTELILIIKDQLNYTKQFIVFGQTISSDFCESSELLSLCSDEFDLPKLSEFDEAAIYFSSGTTGLPKAILLSHYSIASAGSTELCHHRQAINDIFMIIPALYHTGAFVHWLGSLISGSAAIIIHQTNPKFILQTISDEKVTNVWLLLPLVQDILDSIEVGDINLNEYKLESWRLMHMGAQPIPAEVVMRWKNIFPKQQIDINYGLTESCGPGCVHLGIENTKYDGSIGKPGVQWKIKIVDTHDKIVPAGQIGELVVKGPGVMLGYYNDSLSTTKTLKNGWLHTGDMAYEDKDGFIYLAGRKKDLIITGGENVYPIQIENFLRRHNSIKDVAIIGSPDYRLGEIVVAIIELKKNMYLSKKEIIDFCKGLPAYMRPRKVYFDIIPRNATGKINKVILRKKYSQK